MASGERRRCRYLAPGNAPRAAGDTVDIDILFAKVRREQVGVAQKLAINREAG